jgi:hypothetical protein
MVLTTPSHIGFNVNECGEPKNKDNNLKVVELGAAVQENKIPLFIQAKTPLYFLISCG